MTAERGRGAGWDAKAIQRIAQDQYGGMTELFEAHGWPERGRHMLPAVQGRVADVYGTIVSFERVHQNVLMNPIAAVASKPPNVWLTSFYSFEPRNWGFFGFTDKRMRTHFLKETSPGALVVVYGASRAHRPEDRKMILGLQQVTHRTDHARAFMSEEHWKEKRNNPDRRNKWNYAVEAGRAWRIAPPSRMPIDVFAPVTYARRLAQVIGARGMRLHSSEAKRILDLDIEEVPVLARPIVGASATGRAREVLAPSRPGPVSQAPYFVPEAEGPKHLYILKLNGDRDAFLGRSASGQLIAKVGFSKDPTMRCADLNRCLPRGAYRWTIHKATSTEGREPFPSSGNALAAERSMKDDLLETGSSLGGEFFLAGTRAVEDAWRRAIDVAQNWSSD